MREARSSSYGVNGLVCVWIPVQGTDGRTRMEARWVLESDAVTHPAA